MSQIKELYADKNLYTGESRGLTSLDWREEVKFSAGSERFVIELTPTPEGEKFKAFPASNWNRVRRIWRWATVVSPEKDKGLSGWVDLTWAGPTREEAIELVENIIKDEDADSWWSSVLQYWEEKPNQRWLLLVVYAIAESHYSGKWQNMKVWHTNPVSLGICWDNALPKEWKEEASRQRKDIISGEEWIKELARC